MKNLALALGLAFLCLPLAAQHDFPGFTSYTFYNFGFRAGTVISTYQDRQGYLWFCTLGGLDRWDGTNLKHYPYDRQNPRAMPESLVFSILQDKTGQYWVNSQNCLSRLDPRLPVDSAVTRFVRAPGNPDVPLLTDLDLQLVADENGNFWSAWPKKGGLLFWKPDLLEFDFKKIRSEDGSEDLKIQRTQPDSVGHRMWFISDKHGVCSMGTTDFKVEHYENDLRRELQRIWNEQPDILQRTTFFWAKKGYFWCISGGKPFTQFDVRTRQATVFQCENGIYENPVGPNGEFYFEDVRGNFWFTRESQGVYFLDMAARKCTAFQQVQGDPNALAGNMGNPICGDRQGNVWICHRSNGVSKFNYALKKSTHEYPFGFVHGQPELINGFYVDKAGNEYIKTAATGFFGKPVGAAAWQKFPDYRGGSFFQDHEKTVYMADERGFFRVSANPAGFEPLPVQPNAEARALFAKGGNLYHDHRESEPILWLFHWESGLYRYFIQRGHTELVSRDTSIFGKDNGGLLVGRDSKNNLWLRMNDGFARFNTENQTWKKWTYDPEDINFMAIPPYWGAMVDSKDRLWFASIENGAVWFDGEKFHSATRAVPGLVPRCYAVSERANGEIWFATSRNFVSFTPETGRYRIYKDMGGGQYILFPNDSTVIIGNFDHYYHVPVPRPGEQIVRPKTVISELRIFEDDRTDLLTNAEITLRHDQNFLRFSFGTLNFVDGENSRFAYKLEGADADWVEPKDGRSFAAYSTLPPGEYTFRVKSCTADGIWDEIGVSKKITILPAWWQTWWFRSLLFAVAGVPVWWFFHQLTLRKLTAQRAELEKTHALNRERERIARDMHDDLGSGLSAIQLLSNFVKNKPAEQAPELRAEIEKIASTSADLNQRVREIIWTVSAGADSLQSLTDFLRRYCVDFQEIAKTEVVFSTPDLPNFTLPSEVRRNLFLCVKEALNNAAKYAEASKIEVTMRFENSFLELSVRDNGRGFDLEKALENGGNGLRNIQRRMADIGGAANFKTGRGTLIQLKANLLQSNNS